MTMHMHPVNPILLVDDEPAWLRSLSLTLRESMGANNIVKCSDSRAVIGILAERRFSLVLLDLTMPFLSGQDLLQMIVEQHPDLPVIILSGINQAETGVQCMHRGAFDYFVKTTEKERLVAGIRRALSMQALRDENRGMKERLIDDRLTHPEVFADIHTGNRRMRALFQYCEAISQSSEPVLITGESGVGKERMARAVHESSRSNGPLIAVNAAGLDDNVFSDTLFGHVRGSFTGADQDRSGMIEAAAGGSLFLDEIGDLSTMSQIKLLRLLQEGEYFKIGSDIPRKVKCRFICATNRELSSTTGATGFRQDLYYRLAAHQIHIPPLRERLDDLHLLVPLFLEEAAGRLGKKTPSLPKEIYSLLSLYNFPGNIRELRAMIYHAVSLHRSHILSLDSFKEKMGFMASETSTGPDTIQFPNKLPSLDETSQLVVSEAISRSGGNQSQAAAMLGISRQALQKRLKKQELR